MRIARLVSTPATTLFLVMFAALPVALALPLVSVPPQPANLAVAGFVLLLLVFTLWPWAVLPVSMIGAPVAGVTLGATDVRSMVLLHMLPLVAGAAGLVLRRLLDDRSSPAEPVPGWLAMAVVGLTVVCGTVFGLVQGNRSGDIVVAAYEVGVIPAYFYLGMYTLGRPRWLRNAAVLYVGTITVMTTVELSSPGRHGGLLTLVAVAPVVVLVGRARGIRRIGLAFLAAVLTIDVVLSSFRSIWVAAVIALVLMALRGDRAVLHGFASTVAAATVLFGLFALQGGIAERAGLVTASLERDAGYRLAEATVGLDVFAGHPLAGAGLGQSTLGVTLPGFGITDVGPVYHAFYVLVLANLGLAGLCLVMGPVLWLARVGFGPAERGSLALAFSALTCGFIVAAVFAGPTDGHWELGLLPALALLTRRGRAPEPAR